VLIALRSAAAARTPPADSITINTAPPAFARLAGAVAAGAARVAFDAGAGAGTDAGSALAAGAGVGAGRSCAANGCKCSIAQTIDTQAAPQLRIAGSVAQCRFRARPGPGASRQRVRSRARDRAAPHTRRSQPAPDTRPHPAVTPLTSRETRGSPPAPAAAGRGGPSGPRCRSR
jgi:hypothetical protein